MGDQIELKRLHLEFLKRSQGANETGTICRAEIAAKQMEAKAITFQGGDFKNGSYTMEITFNLHATLQEIEKALIAEVMPHVGYHKRFMEDIDFPEAREPEREIKQGSRSDESELQFMRDCLKAYDMFTADKTIKEIAMNMFTDMPGTNSWESSRQKAWKMVKKAELLILSAMRGNFPEYR